MFKLILFLLVLITVIPCPQLMAREATAIIDIADRLELFVDHFLVDSLDGATLRLHPPQNAGPVLFFDRPWEGPFSGYVTVIRDGDLYRLYYRGLPKARHDTGLESLCYAESDDGITWRKPDLGLVLVDSSYHNNVIFTHSKAGTHSFSPFIDTRPGVPDDQRFKALGLERPENGHDWTLAGFTSADGIHWTRISKGPLIRNDTDHFAFDSQNVAFWSESESTYVAYVRTWKDDIRRISRLTSPDFLHWSSSQLMHYHRLGQPAPLHHLYTNQTHPYSRAPHIYIATAARFMPGRRVLSEEQAREIGVNVRYFNDTSDAVLLTSRGGTDYDYTFISSFIRPGIGARNWVSRTNYPAWHVVKTGNYYMSVYVQKDYAQPTAHLARYEMRLDGFASVSAPFEGGTLVTKPLIFKGKFLYVNFSTSAAGSVRIEITDMAGNPLAGYAAAECHELIGDEIDRRVEWQQGASVESLAGAPVRLRFYLSDADVFAFQFTDDPETASERKRKE